MRLMQQVFLLIANGHCIIVPDNLSAYHTESKCSNIMNTNFRQKCWPRYAGVPTTDRRNDFSPMILANPKSQSFTWKKKKKLSTMWMNILRLKRQKVATLNIFTFVIKSKFTFHRQNQFIFPHFSYVSDQSNMKFPLSWVNRVIL